MQERGLVYCVQGQCILVPTICRNVSRITQAPASAPPAAGGAAPGGAAPVAAAPAAPEAAGVPVIDNPDALRGGSFTVAPTPPKAASMPFLPFDYVRTAGGITPPVGTGGGGAGGGGGGLPPGSTGSSISATHRGSCLPTLPPTGPNSPAGRAGTANLGHAAGGPGVDGQCYAAPPASGSINADGAIRRPP